MSWPELGPSVPRRRSAVLRAIGKSIFGMSGFRLEGTLPDIPKAVLIFAPHTTNWDFVLGMSVLLGLDLNARWMGKHSIFVPPLSGVLRALGGIPIERQHRHQVVQRAIYEFSRRDQLYLGIAPEGTRKKVAEWKTGFYYIAQGANVPIVPSYVDYPGRRLGFGPALSPCGDIDRDLAELKQFYEPFRGLHPERQ